MSQETISARSARSTISARSARSTISARSARSTSAARSARSTSAARSARSTSAARPWIVRRLARRDQKGVALLEFALVAPIFFFVLYGLITFGMALAVKQGVTNAAAEAARSAVGSSTPVSTATSTVASRLGWLGSKYVAASDLTVTYLNPTSGVCDAAYTPASGVTGVSLCVTVNIPYKTRNIIPSAPIVNGVLPNQLKSTAVVQIN